MNVILMRKCKNSESLNEITESFKYISDTYDNVSVFTSSNDGYLQDLLYMQRSGLAINFINTPIYNPDNVTGNDKLDLVKNVREPVSEVGSLYEIFHSLSLEINNIINRDGVVVFYFDLLILEIIYSILNARPIDSITKGTIYLDELAVAILGISEVDNDYFCILYKNNFKIKKSLSHVAHLRLVP